MLTRAGEREQVKRARTRTSIHSESVCVRASLTKAADESAARVGCPWVTLLKRTGNAISSRGITITKTTRWIRGVLVGVRAYTLAGAIYTEWPPHLHTTSGHPAKPMYAFSYLAPNKPFLRVDSRRDGYGLGTLHGQTVLRATPSLSALVNYCF